MRIHYLQHVPFEGPGFIAEWASGSGHRLTGTALFKGEPLPDRSGFDLLAVMGGPMGVHDDVEHSWLSSEKKFIESVLGLNKPIVGICLGAQLIADVLGARVYKNRHREIGWHPVDKNDSAERTGLDAIIPDRFDAFHWHGDTFALPAGAVHLVRSKACINQAFFYPPATVALQFHLETTKAGIEALIEQCGHELVPAPFIQTSATIRSKSHLTTTSNLLMEGVMEFVASL